LVAEWLANGRQLHVPITYTPQLSVNEVLLRFTDWAEAYYGDGDCGRKEVANLKHAMRPVKLLYGTSPAIEFGPKALKAVREHMVTQQDLCRTEVNKRITRIKRLFKWAASEELSR